MLVFLSGSKDSGKTSTARWLRVLVPNLAVVEPDAFFRFLPYSANRSFDEAGLKCVELAGLVMRELLAQGCSVLVVYPLSDADHARFMRAAGPAGEGARCFTLAPPKEVIFKRIEAHHKNAAYLEHRRQQIERHYQTGPYDLGVVRPKYPATVIDTSRLTPRATARRIARELGF